jgi:hypothetical protein
MEESRPVMDSGTLEMESCTLEKESRPVMGSGTLEMESCTLEMESKWGKEETHTLEKESK